jgi:hypothetical protein
MSEKLFILRSSQVAWRRLDTEVMIMSAKDSSLFSLNETAAILWEAADGTTSLEEIVARRICPRFDVDAVAAFVDAEVLARQLAEYGILTIASEPVPASMAMRAHA